MFIILILLPHQSFLLVVASHFFWCSMTCKAHFSFLLLPIPPISFNPWCSCNFHFSFLLLSIPHVPFDTQFMQRSFFECDTRFRWGLVCWCTHPSILPNCCYVFCATSPCISHPCCLSFLLFLSTPHVIQFYFIFYNSCVSTFLCK